MGKQRGLTKLVSSTTDTIDLAFTEIFTQELDLTVLLAKYGSYRNAVANIIARIEQFLQQYAPEYTITEWVQNTAHDYATAYPNINALYLHLKEYYARTEYANTPETTPVYSSAFIKDISTELFINSMLSNIKADTPATLQTICDEFDRLINCSRTADIITMTAQLTHYNRFLNDTYIESLKDDTGERVLSFLCKLAATKIAPLNPITDCDLKSVELHVDNSSVAIITFLKTTLGYCSTIYDVVMTPNINITKFCKLLVDSIQRLRTELPSCKDAFDLIEHSTSLLERRFTYNYQNYVVNNNNSLNFGISMLTDLIEDKTCNLKPRAILQMRLLIKFIAKRTQQNQGHINERMKELQKSMFCVSDMMNKFKISKDSYHTDAESIELERLAAEYDLDNTAEVPVGDPESEMVDLMMRGQVSDDLMMKLIQEEDEDKQRRANKLLKKSIAAKKKAEFKADNTDAGASSSTDAFMVVTETCEVESDHDDDCSDSDDDIDSDDDDDTTIADSDEEDGDNELSVEDSIRELMNNIRKMGLAK